jgi:hypothetical protein
MKQHRKTFREFDLIYIKKCVNYEIVEKQFEKELKIKKIHRIITFDNVRKKELFTLSTNITIDTITDMMDNLIKCFPIDRKLEISKHKYKMLVEMNNKKKLDIIYNKILLERQKLTM